MGRVTAIDPAELITRLLFTISVSDKAVIRFALSRMLLWECGSGQ